MGPDIDVAVIGGGQAGLSVSHGLTRFGVEHVVLERGRVGETWRGRWDTFCLVTPNWTIQLPGGAYDGDDPDGYLARDHIVGHLERYAAGFGAPIEGGVEVTSLARAGEDGFVLRTASGDLRTRCVVVSTGAYQRAHRPRGADTVPPDLLQIDVEDYRSPGGLPPGAVLVIGSGQSGCQIAEELLEDGREVVLACGKAPWALRRIGDRDLVWWLVESGFMDQPVESLASPQARLFANVLGTGHGGGHDLHYRTLRRAGVTLVGHFLGCDAGSVRFAPDLAESVAWGDERYRMIMDLVRKVVAERGLPMPDIPEPEPFDEEAPKRLDLARFGAVIFAGGFRPDYRWIEVPGAVDDMGFPIQSAGASAVAPGLFFVGVHFLRKRKSSLLYGVGEDAEIVSEQIVRRSSASTGS